MELASVWPNLLSSQDSYDLLICAVGYEERSVAVAKRVHDKARTKIAWAFSDRKLLNYSENREWFEAHEFEIVEEAEKQVTSILLNRLDAAAHSALNGRPTVAVDLSCFTRTRLAILLNCLDKSEFKAAKLIPIYCLAKYSAPEDSTAPNQFVGPVTSEFAGWFSEPERPLAVIAGLGYEENKALGAVEHLQADYCWAFIPTSGIAEYEPRVLEANKSLLDSIPAERRIKYEVEDPATTFGLLNSLCHGLSRTHNLVLLPFGPKLFSFICLLRAFEDRTSAVWRVSAGEGELPIQRVASDKFVSFLALFEQRQASASVE